jgi:hypothetical protein
MYLYGLQLLVHRNHPPFLGVPLPPSICQWCTVSAHHPELCTPLAVKRSSLRILACC